MTQEGLYISDYEKDACGVGFVAQLKGEGTHEVVASSLRMLCNLEHRGALGAEKNSGDGAGILVQIPHSFLQKKVSSLGIKLPNKGSYGVGNVFFSPSLSNHDIIQNIYADAADSCGLNILGWREVPVNKEAIGGEALRSCPDIWQVFISPKEVINEDVLERKLFVLRKYVDKLVNEKSIKGFYTCSLSCRKLIYKGQLSTGQVGEFYEDLKDPEFTSRLALVHSRFSTNTFPSWRRAQPFRFIAHNGEINTLRGNQNWMRARKIAIDGGYFSLEDFDKMGDSIEINGSDSAVLDNVIELLHLCGRSLPQTMMMLIPEAWAKNDLMSPEKKAFYTYHASFMEPWDGPASVAFTDGKMIGATLDRNGLRPSRYCVTKDGLLVMSSEQGSLPIEESQMVSKGRLQSGKMFWADLENGKIISDEELKKEICTEYDYISYIKEAEHKIPNLKFKKPTEEKTERLELQRFFGYTKEDISVILEPMAIEGKEPIGSMGNDVPLAVLSNFSHNLFNYFYQLFAQVTNPPIDPIREEFVMSLNVFCGKQRPLLDTNFKNIIPYLLLDTPFLLGHQMQWFLSKESPFACAQVSMLDVKKDFEKSLDAICEEVVNHVKSGVTIIVLSDRGVDANIMALPSLLVTAAVHHTLIRIGLRSECCLIVEAGDVREVHHFAVLLGYGAEAVHPYLAFQTIENNYKEWGVESVEKASANYVNALGKGLLKVMSKMGISTLQSYIGAQIFEPVGLSQELINKYFTGSHSRLGGIGIEQIEEETRIRHSFAFGMKQQTDELEAGGQYSWRRRGERHLFSPKVIHSLQNAVLNNDYKQYREFANAIDDQGEKLLTLRGMLEFIPAKSIPLDEVEPIESILPRFATGAMSLGSISREAHETLAIAMNRIGAKSNTGEGGEDPVRFKPLPNGDSACSAIKQVASGRFGVTSHYLSMAKEIQIKMAQGAKPGEGGQLPGQKVDEYIASLRHSTPGVGLISPPPHHDIYSIEDLAQLIYDLKNANESARINVKLVSEIGVGMIASGVSKAHADVVLIAGADGGTGASPLTSLKHAGLPWELGLAEVHQTLVRNNLRSRIVLQTDGQLRTGRDLAIATLLGAEEWGVATSALVTMGCIMMRKCHLNTCPVGIATQDTSLRELFTGDPEHVVNYFKFLAQDLREIMAQLGFTTIDSMVGAVNRLRPRKLSHWKAKYLDLSALLFQRDKSQQFASISQEHGIEHVLDRQLVKVSKPALEQQKKVDYRTTIKNTDRAVGAILSNKVSFKYGGQGLPPNTITITFEGDAGQSFGAFTTKGIKFILEGTANDYFGKGVCGAKLILKPHIDATFDSHQSVIVGNVAFYGATSGESYIGGLAGERFCVRNSGVEVVVEGVGDNACEYMTGGRVIILGDIGRNFAAGMSGGIAYIWDPEGKAFSHINQEMVDLESLEDLIEINYLFDKINNHIHNVGSTHAQKIISDWSNQIGNFIKIMPRDYKRVLESMSNKEK